MIDLSFLTEEEQETILTVLKRDSQLKRTEEKRVQNLQMTVSDKDKLKYLTGEWFYQTKQLRHQDRVHGSDIIRASIKHRNKPTAMMVSPISPEESSSISTDNKDLLVPLLLSRLQTESHTEPDYDRDQGQTRPDLASPTKQRKNPFNSNPISPHVPEESEIHVTDGFDETQTSNQDLPELHQTPELLHFDSSYQPFHLEKQPEEDGKLQTTEWIHQQHTPLLVNATSGDHAPTNHQAKTPSSKLPQSLVDIFREKVKNVEINEEMKLKRNDKDNQRTLHVDTAKETTNKPPNVEQEATDVRTLQLTALLKTPFREVVVSSDHHLDRKVPQDSQGNVRAWREKESSPEIIRTREQERVGGGGPGVPLHLQTTFDVESRDGNLPLDRDRDHQVPGHISPGQTQCPSPEDSSPADRTYRAHPVVISEEMDDSEPPENVSSSWNHTDAPTQSCSPEHRPDNVRHRQHSWEEGEEPKVMTAQSNETSDVKSLLDRGETSEEHGDNVPSRWDQDRETSPERQTQSSKEPDPVRRSPSKTCHPRVLPRESSRLEGSYLKTFPIDIDPHVQVQEERPAKSTPAPSLVVLTEPQPQTVGAALPLRSQKPVQDSSGSSWTGPPYHNLSNQSGTSAWLPRSFSPQKEQHLQDRAADAPPAGRSHTVNSPNVLQGFEKSQNQGPTEASPGSNPKQKVKTCVSLPLVQQDEMVGDSALETTWSWRRNTSSSMSNLSLSSGITSTSSVSGSIDSLHRADLEDVEVRGSIEFAVNYIQKLEEFQIFVVLCRDLAVADSKKKHSDPYVKCYLLPDKTKLGKRKTSVKKKTLNPTYNEILCFELKMEVLREQHLSISVWHHDTFGRNSFLGEVDLNMSEWDFSNTQINEYALKAKVSLQAASPPSYSGLTTSRGQMRVALRFLPQTSHGPTTSGTETGELQIWVKDCKNLSAIRGTIMDPFVKCTVLPDTSRKNRQKTRVVKRTVNPMFNHTMVYDGLRPQDLQETCVEITVWDHDRLNNHYIGGLRLGLGTGKSYGVEAPWMDSSPDEAVLWRRMLQSEGDWVEEDLPLRRLLLAKRTSIKAKAHTPESG